EHAFPVEDDFYAAFVSHCPRGLRRPKIFSRINPVDTGGITSGKRTIVSTTLLSGHSLRAKSHASAMPNGKISRALPNPTEIEKRVMCQVSKLKNIR